jgi:nitroreductase
MSPERIEFLRTLRSVRTFTADPVPDAVMDDILTVARWSGSSMNAQPWELIVIRDRDMLAKLAALEGYAAHLAGAQAGIVLVMAVVDKEQEVWDEGKLAERIMLAAWAHGVGACVGWILGDGVRELRELLGIPADRRVRTTISLGYPDPASRVPTRGGSARKPLEEIVSYERYG